MKSGIYKITNLKNGRLYIGSAKNLKEREVNHFSMLRNNKHSSIILQRAWNKSLDKSLFKFEIIEFCKEEELIDKENYYLNSLCKSNDYILGKNKDFRKISYNILPIASKGFSGRHSPESLEKMRMNHPLRKNILIYKDKIYFDKATSAAGAHNLTKVSKTRILESCKEKTFITKSGYYFCFEQDKLELESKIDTISIQVYNKGMKYVDKSKFTQRIKIKVTNIQTGEVLPFNSQIEACDFLRLQPCTVNRCIKSGKPYKKYLRFEIHNL